MIPQPAQWPLLQLGGLSGQQIMDSLTQDYIQWGGIGALLLLVLFFGRFILRSIVNKRVHGIQESSMGFMDLDAMYKKGLVTREEYMTMRNRVAHRELERIKEADVSRESLHLVSTVAKNPALARVIIEKELSKSEDRPQGAAATPAARQPTASQPSAPQARPASPAGASAPAAPIPPPDPDAIRRKIQSEWIMPGDPLTDPRLARNAEPKPMPPPASARGKARKPMDIEDLLARGLISREEYDRLAALFEKEN